MKNGFGGVIALTALVLAMPGSAAAAGFAVAEQSPGGMSTAFSNAAAVEDASVIWYNPAGMGFLGGTNITAGGTIILPYSDFDIDGGETTNAAGAAQTGGDGDDGGVAKLAPVFYISNEIRAVEGLSIGLGVNSPFGLVTAYENGWVGRYAGLASEMLSVNINPAISYRVLPWLSVGGGVSIMYMRTDLSQAIDATALATGNAASGLDDSRVDLDASGWGYGFNAGIMVQPWEGGRFGAHYRGPVSFTDLKGEAIFIHGATGAAVSAGTGTLVNTATSADLTMPESISINGYQELTDSLAIHGDVTWTRWSRVETISIGLGNPLQAGPSLDFSYSDSWRVALGATYDVDDDMTLRFGVAWDQSPQGDEVRGVRLPDNDRYWFSTGMSWDINNVVQVNGGYTFLYIKRATTDIVTPTVGGGGNRTSGTFGGIVHLLAGQVVLKFDP